MQRVSSHHLPILSLSVPKVVFFKFRTTFSSFAAFLNATPQVVTKIFLILQCKISFCIHRHQFEQNQTKNKKARVPFSFGSVTIFCQFIKIYVFKFSGRFRTRGAILSGSRRWRKISRNLKKK